jgi:hypothetical protein
LSFSGAVKNANVESGGRLCPRRPLAVDPGRLEELREQVAVVRPAVDLPSRTVSTVAGIVVPFASIVVGAGITYVINVRQRRRNYVEDLMNAAIASAAAAEVSVDFLASAGPSPHMTDDDYERFQSRLVTEGMKRWATSVADATSRLLAWCPIARRLASSCLQPGLAASRHRQAHHCRATDCDLTHRGTER